MLDSVKMAAIAVDTKPGDLQGNFSKIDRWAAQAVDQGAQLALFPELSLCGFIPNHPEANHDAWLRATLQSARALAESVPGPACDRLTQIAAERGILISVGLLEDAGNLLFNTQVLVGPDGLLGKWRKLHIPMFEMPFYNGGDHLPVVKTPLGLIGVNICFDALMPESTRLLAVENVEIVLFPFAADPPPPTPAGWHAWASPALSCRCAENGVFGIACNYVGHVEFQGVQQTFPGGGVALDPRGNAVANWSTPTGEPGMLLAEFHSHDLLAARSEPEYLYRFRRPELYAPLSRPETPPTS